MSPKCPKSQVDYWLARNSWGKGWGLEGLFKIKKGTNELGIEANVAFNAVEVSQHLRDCEDTQTHVVPCTKCYTHTL